MATGFEDWSGSTIDAEPTGWTKRFGTSNTAYAVQADAAGPAGHRLRIAKSSSSQRVRK